jgi:hypothetical protein
MVLHILMQGDLACFDYAVLRLTSVSQSPDPSAFAEPATTVLSPYLKVGPCEQCPCRFAICWSKLATYLVSVPRELHALTVRKAFTLAG